MGDHRGLPRLRRVGTEVTLDPAAMGDKRSHLDDYLITVGLWWQ